MVFTIRHTGEMFCHSVEFMGHAGKLINTVLCKEKGVTGLEIQLCRRRRTQIRDLPWLFCSASLVCSSTSAALVLHQWFVAFSAALLFLLHKMLYCSCSLGKLGLFVLALRKCMHTSPFFLDRLVSSLETQSCTATVGKSAISCSISKRAYLRDLHGTSTVQSSWLRSCPIARASFTVVMKE